MLGERVVIIVDGMLVNLSVDMPMRDNVTMSSIVRVIENEVEVVVTAVSGRRLRCGNEHALQRHSHRRRHHQHEGDASRQWLRSEVQACRLSQFGPGLYPRVLYYDIGCRPQPGK